MSDIKLYVVGFLFSEDKSRVVLIHKNKPVWQTGLLNGVGGKIEQDEAPKVAMRREFEEETGLNIPNWKYYLAMTGDSWCVYFFHTTSKDIDSVESITDEKVEIFNVSDINSLPVIPNLKWSIPMCFDEYIQFATVKCS